MTSNGITIGHVQMEVFELTVYNLRTKLSLESQLNHLECEWMVNPFRNRKLIGRVIRAFFWRILYDYISAEKILAHDSCIGSGKMYSKIN